MLQEWLMPQVEDDRDDFVHQTVPHYHHLIRISLNLQLPQCWIGQMTTEDQVLRPWPPRLPDPTPRDYFYGDILRTVSFFCCYHRICLSCKDKSLLLSQQLIVACCSRYGQKWIISLRSAVWQKADTHITFEVWKKKTWWISLPSVGRMLQSFLAFKRTDFMKFRRIMNNSVYMT